MDEKYYLAITITGKLRALFTNEDLDYIAEQNGGNRNPFVIFNGTGSVPDEVIADIYVSELTNQGLIYTAKLDRDTLQEISL